MKSSSGRAFILVLPALLALPSSARSAEGELTSDGQLSQKFKIDEQNPEAGIPTEEEKNKNPLEFGYLLQDLVTRAEQARKQHDNGAVVRYYRAVAKAVPDQAKGWSKLCEAYQVVNDNERAVRACKYAIERPGSELQDYVRFVGLTLSKPGALTSDERADMKKVLDHLARDPAAGVTASHLQCQVGAKTHDVPLLEACTAALKKIAPDDPKTVIFQWSLAVQKGQQAEAAQLIERAKLLGVIPENIERMQNFTSPAGPAWFRWSVLVLVLLSTAGAGMLWLVRRARPRPGRVTANG